MKSEDDERGTVASALTERSAVPGDESVSRVDAASLGRKARAGLVVLLVRMVARQIVVLVGTILLARLLEPRDFGVFAIVQFAVAFFALFGNAGLGAALIQRKQPPNNPELSSVFTAQIALSAGLIAVMAVSASQFRWLWPDLPAGSAWLFRVLSIALLLVSIRVVPMILMERELEFGRLAAVEVIDAIAFYGSAVWLAYLGLGVWALVASVLLQNSVSLIVAYALRPWRPRMIFDKKLLRPIVSYGVKYQLKYLIGFANSATLPIYAGSMLGTRNLGLITWAQTTAALPMRLIEALGRISFPLYSRLQAEPALLAESIGRTIQIGALGIAFSLAILLGLGPQLVHIVFTDKWLPGLPLLYVYAMMLALGFLSPLVGTAFDALGKPGVFVRLSVGWTILNWIVLLVTTPLWGTIGFVWGFGIHVIVGNVVAIVLLLRLVPTLKFWRRLWVAGLAGAISFLAARLIADRITALAELVAAIFGLLILFGGAALLLDARGLKRALSMVSDETNPR